MMKKGLFALWLSSVGLAFLLGYKLNPAPLATERPPHFLPAQPQPGAAPKRPTQQKQIAGTAVPAKQTTAANRHEAAEIKDSLTRIKSLLGNSNMLMDMEGIAQSYLLVKQFTEQDVLDSLALLQGELEQTDNMMPLMLILGHYGELNPQQAIIFTQENISSAQTKMAAMSSILGNWSKQDPLAAYDWFLATRENESSSGFFNTNSVGLMSIFNGLTKRDLDDAITKLTDILDNSSNTMMAVSGITAAFTEKEQFIHFIEKTKAFDDRRIQESVLSTWAMKNPRDTVEWLNTIENQADKKALQQDVLRNWMFSQPLEAATWYMDQASANDRQSASEQIITQWGPNNPNATLNWLEQQADIDSEASAKVLLETSVHEHPLFAIEHLERLSSDQDKQRLSFNIYLALERESKQKAANFVSSSPYKEALEHEIREYQQEQLQHANRP
ncbi:hypothetical protein [Thalassomonas haliotis]|uniref:Uncharacterized protein n=1 Tax=Thalassomonas haliotis TaxID=485448 RepID=A0ABY7VAE5_9GAMM|nr:hypothetical protein [Thalassomonas haliotis]WDE10301.1 hypothetical protein H3N35_18745 [Thalassomonas haliotis]